MGYNLLDSNSFATLPPEILDKILEQISANREGRPTLLACALVATWWTGPSQRRLFSSVEIYESSYRLWINGVILSGSKARLLGYIRSLWHSRGLDIGIKYQMRHLPHDSGEYLSALHNLRSLTLYNTWVEHIGEEGFYTCFSAFRETLTFLSLDTFAMSFSAFVTLVDYFPNITTLELDPPVLEPDERPVPSLSRPLRGKLLVHEVQTRHLEFFNQFAELDLEYEELVINSPSVIEPEFLKGALEISTGTVKFLRLAAELHSESIATARDFRQLRELEVNCPSSTHCVLLSSITSLELRKIIFAMRCMPRLIGWRRNEWAFIDEELCRLVNRLRATGYRRTLEVELRVAEVQDDPGQYGFTKLLPGFKEEGVVTVLDAAHGDQLLYSAIQPLIAQVEERFI